MAFRYFKKIYKCIGVATIRIFCPPFPSLSCIMISSKPTVKLSTSEGGQRLTNRPSSGKGCGKGEGGCLNQQHSTGKTSTLCSKRCILFLCICCAFFMFCYLFTFVNTIAKKGPHLGLIKYIHIPLSIYPSI